VADNAATGSIQMVTDWGKMEATNHLFAAMMGLWEFEKAFGRFPAPNNETDVDEVRSLFFFD
jgi:hypothetical protein